MLRLALLSTRWRLVGGLVAVLALAALLPPAPAARIWWGALAALAAPWLVLGRQAVRQAQGWAGAAAAAPRGGWLVGLELALPLAVVAVGALVVTGAQPAATLVLGAWGAALVSLADALDRGRTGPGTAWSVCLGLGLAVLAAPLWLAPFFGHPSAPSLATWAIGLHPAGAALQGAGLPVLTDAYFYRWTLSGVVEALPLPWTRGAVVFALLALVAAVAGRSATLRPPQGVAR